MYSIYSLYKSQNSEPPLFPTHNFLPYLEHKMAAIGGLVCEGLVLCVIALNT